jgi:hypothetical protein
MDEHALGRARGGEWQERGRLRVLASREAESARIEGG